jgi:hypothetical protein
VSVALDYGREHAPEDVLGCLDWLASEGFVLAGERGGRGEAFGNVQLMFERPAMAVRITRDRGQWSLWLAPDRSEFIPLNVLLTAWNGGTPAPRDRPFGDPLPEVLPEGAKWDVVVPGIVSWLDSGDRTREIRDADNAWKSAMRRWWRDRARAAAGAPNDPNDKPSDP